MNNLSQLDCEVCDGNTKLLSPSEIMSMLQQLPDWRLDLDNGAEKLKIEMQTKNYAQSIKLTNQIAELAESADHHPQIIVEYAKVTVFWWTHTINGLHINDFILAAKTSELFNSK